MISLRQLEVSPVIEPLQNTIVIMRKKYDDSAFDVRSFYKMMERDRKTYDKLIFIDEFYCIINALQLVFQDTGLVKEKYLTFNILKED